ncbi:hypothetical protein [Pseudomonas citronellolis]|nr:hypothetical protein [Pseudomonas citronellolis]
MSFFAPIFLTQRRLLVLKRSEMPRAVNVSSIQGSLAHLSSLTC